MPRGYVGAIAPDDARAFADALAVQTEEAGVAAGGWIERETCVAGVPVSLAFTDPMIAERSTSAIAGRAVERFPGISIRVWDTQSTGVVPPPPAWAWHASRYQSDEVIVTYERERRRLALVDLAHRSACYWMASPASWPPWEEAAPFRDVLDRLLAPMGHVFLHGGTLGDEDVAVLLAGPSGSGKSTTTAAGIGAGMTTLGDDYVVLDPDGVQVHALYRILRLEPSSPAAALVGEGPVDHQGKLMVPMPAGAHSPLRTSLRIVAIATPSVTGAPATTLRPVGAAAALKALAPTSLVQLDPRADSLRRMRELVERVPCYALDLGLDLDGVVACVRKLLDRHR
jgi:hypothetical protein